MSTWIIVLVSTLATLLLTGVILFIWQQLAPRENKVTATLDHLYSPDDEQFLRTMAALFTAPCHAGNRVVGLRNGDRIFPEMLDAIAHARRTITFETYIYWSGEMAWRFAEALSERARSGVAVHVLLDWFGSLPIDQEIIRMMKTAGIEVETYHKPGIIRPQHANHRTHRKLLVVDGSVGFSGGVGIADEWTGDAEDPDHWRDSHYRLEGPGVWGLQRAFMDNWVKARGTVLHGTEYFPPLDTEGGTTCQVFQSSPDGGSDSVRLMFLLAIAAAEDTIRICTAYFVPDPLATKTLREARARGVKVEVIVPGDHNDSRLVRLVSRAKYGRLLREGIEIYEYQPTMFHVKSMIVDDVWVSVGSTNFDNRSFRLNDEVNLNVFDRHLAQDQIDWFEHDKRCSKRIELEEWGRRPFKEKLKERAALLFRSQI